MVEWQSPLTTQYLWSTDQILRQSSKKKKNKLYVLHGMGKTRVLLPIISSRIKLSWHYSCLPKPHAARAFKRRNISFSWSESGKVFLESKQSSGHWRTRKILMDLEEVGDTVSRLWLSPSEWGAFWELVVFNGTFVKTKLSFCSWLNVHFIWILDYELADFTQQGTIREVEKNILFSVMMHLVSLHFPCPPRKKS